MVLLIVAMMELRHVLGGPLLVTRRTVHQLKLEQNESILSKLGEDSHPVADFFDIKVVFKSLVSEGDRL